MIVRLPLILALAAPLAAFGEDSRPPREGTPPEVEKRVIDIPRASYHPAGSPVTRPLRRTADLLQMLWDGQGKLSHGGGEQRGLHGAVSLQALPWRAPEAARLTLRSLGKSADEAALSLHLWSGDAWCTPPLDLAPESRLRFEAVAVETPGTARLGLAWRPAAGPGWTTTVEAGPPGEPALRSSDVPLPAGPGTLCFRAEGRAVSIGEPRVLAPEAEGSDPRPRWIVLVITDAMRGDLLDRPDAERIAPTLVALSRRGHRYLEAVSPGAHTQAALWPLLTGRDLARVDPVRAGRFTPQGTPLSLVYSRANLAVSHLAQAAGYHSVFLGNNSFLRGVPLFARFSNRGEPDTGTVDTIAALPPLLARYADERVFLVYYLSTPHSYSFTPRRLFDRLGCPSLGGVEAARCAYEARVAHADEAIEALEQGLAHHGLQARTLQVLTADHGEVFGDARKIEVQLYDRWSSLDEGHGGSTHWKELHVPLVVSGPGLTPGTWPGRVSSLDIVPTLAVAGGFAVPHRFDGRVLPLAGGPRTPPPLVVSQGYCTHSVMEGPRQLVWWEAECARRRELGTGRPITHRAEIWQGGSLDATDETAPARLAPLVRRHLDWLAARLPNDAWILDTSRLGSAEVRVGVSEGRIVDWGPSRSMGHFALVSTALREDERELRIVLREFPGLFYFATWPSGAPVRIDVDRGGAASPVAFVGPLQLPLAVFGRVANPGERPELWVAASEPARQPSPGPDLRVWREPYRAPSVGASSRALTELDRVLREWGYIR